MDSTASMLEGQWNNGGICLCVDCYGFMLMFNRWVFPVRLVFLVACSTNGGSSFIAVHCLHLSVSSQFRTTFNDIFYQQNCHINLRNDAKPRRQIYCFWTSIQSAESCIAVSCFWVIVFRWRHRMRFDNIHPYIVFLLYLFLFIVFCLCIYPTTNNAHTFTFQSHHEPAWTTLLTIFYHSFSCKCQQMLGPNAEAQQRLAKQWICKANLITSDNHPLWYKVLLVCRVLATSGNPHVRDNLIKHLWVLCSGKFAGQELSHTYTLSLSLSPLSIGQVCLSGFTFSLLKDPFHEFLNFWMGPISGHLYNPWAKRLF